MERFIFSNTSSVFESRLTLKDAVASTAAVNALVEPRVAKENNPYSLPYLYSALFATILEGTLMELRILAECNNPLREMKVYSDFSKLISQKFAIAEIVVDELDNIDEKNLGQEKYKIDKIFDDRTSVMDAVLKIYSDLCLNQSYGFVVQSVNAFDEHDRYLVSLEIEETNNRTLRRELAKKLRQQRNHMKSVQYDTDNKIDILRREMEDNNILTAIRGRYVTTWQKARLEQNEQRIKEKEGPASEQVEYYKQKLDHEQRVHQEVEMLITIAINELLEKIEYWMNKYDDDMEAADLQVQIKKNRYQHQTDERIELEKTYAKHEQEMKNWIEFKDKREQADAYIANMTKCAIIVQAWWRGLLVRMELGPYKLKKKGKKKK